MDILNNSEIPRKSSEMVNLTVETNTHTSTSEIILSCSFWISTYCLKIFCFRIPQEGRTSLLSEDLSLRAVLFTCLREKRQAVMIGPFFQKKLFFPSLLTGICFMSPRRTLEPEAIGAMQEK